MMSEKWYVTLMTLGFSTGCHQMPERSFFIKGRQMPVCARCFGCLVGHLLAFGTWWLWKLDFVGFAWMCIPMLLDWTLQFAKIKSSTNLRRFITGLPCGYALNYCFLKLLAWIIKCVFV